MDKQQFKSLEGFLITKNNKSILAQAKSLTKPGSFLSEEQQKSYFLAVQQYLDSINGNVSNYDKNNIEITNYSEPAVSNNIFYKYVSKKTLNKYIKNGIFKFGNLVHYQKAQNNKIKDEKEGHTHLIIESEDKQLLQSFYTGYNYLIFCGSYMPPNDPRSKYLKDNFGTCVIKIANTKSFRREIQKHLNIKSSLYRRIDYNEMKILKYNANGSFTDTYPQIINNKTFDLMMKIISPSILFRKPIYYSEEYELRFAFETQRDQKNQSFCITKVC
jgi:hypothetical protein